MSRVLVVEDEGPVRALVARLLTTGRHEAIPAATAAEALRRAEAEAFDLILLDLGLPDADGREVLARLRRAPSTSLLPVIVVTGAGAVSDRVDGLALGADDYVVKPFSCEELLARVDNALRRARLRLSASPLTGLPGAPAIEEEVRARLAEDRAFAFLYADVDGFKPYNDAYGFAKGDEALRALAGLVRETAEACAEGFAGHVGGDDFVLVTAAGDGAFAAQRLSRAFDEAAPGFYLPEHRALGGLDAADRSGRIRRHPLMTLSIGALCSPGKRLTHFAEVVERACEMKRYLKARDRRGVSRFAFDRRGPR